MSASDLLSVLVAVYLVTLVPAFLLACALEDESLSLRLFLTFCWPLALVIAVVRGGKEFLNRCSS